MKLSFNALSARTEEIQSLKEDKAFLRAHDEALLQYFTRSIKFTLVPILGVIAAMTIVLYQQFESAVVFYWTALALFCQIPRLYLAYNVIGDTTRDTRQRIKAATVLALITGICFSSVALLIPQATSETRALLSMILAGVLASSTATNFGYKPLYYTFTTPVFLCLISFWLIDPNNFISRNFQILILLLILQLGLVLHGLVSQVYGFFLGSLFSQDKLSAAWEAEKTANDAKTRFLAAASHDLRQPLHAMSFFSAALVARPLDEESKSIALKMNEAMQALDEELDALLDISKLDAHVTRAQIKSTNLTTLVRLVSDSMQPKAHEKKLKITTDIQPLIYAMTDVDLFARMLRNIIDNAIKYTEVGGVTIALNADDKNIEVLIEDTGPGISEEERENIWEEFYQIDNPARDRTMGMGLGLSVVDRIAKLLNVEIRLGKSDTNGSCFELSLPRHNPVNTPATTTGNEPVSTDTTFLRNRTALIVDDDVNIQLSTSTLLRGLGMSVITAGGTKEAIDHFTNNKIECTLVDLRLADGEDGFDTIDKLRDINPDVPHIILSGDTAPERLKEANARGCPWLVKPVNQEQLIAEFRKIFTS